MSKQEEIREGMKQRLEYDANCHPIKSGWVADELLSYLHSQGVVIRVNDHYEELVDA